MSKAGVRLAEGDRSSSAAGQAASSAGKAARAPHLNGVGKAPPPQVNDVVNATPRRGSKTLTSDEGGRALGGGALARAAVEITASTKPSSDEDEKAGMHAAATPR